MGGIFFSHTRMTRSVGESEPRFARLFVRTPQFLLAQTFSSPCGLEGGDSFLASSITKGRRKVVLLLLVEARGVEPLSENLLIWLSPGAGGYLDFPTADGNRHPAVTGSFFLHDCLKSKRAMHVHRSMTPHPKPRYSWVERAVPQDCVTALGCVS